MPAPRDLSQLSEERLSALALGGDRGAWEVLVQRHERRVLLSLLARGVRVDRAKDIVQDTWARLIGAAREGRLSALELPGLAIRQAMYLAIEEARHASRKISIDDVSAPSLLDPHPTIEERLTSRAALHRAAEELERCSPQAQRVFAMVYDEPGTPHVEAAKRAGLSVQRLRQTLCEVRARLRAAMERSDDPS